MIREVEISMAGKDPVALAVKPFEEPMKLSAWLEAHGMPLNTRCGQMGLCQGCVVELDTPGNSRSKRGCLLRVRDLPEDLLRLRVPERSRRDRGLSGVCAFEIKTETRSILHRPGLGLALDLGTTTLAAALWDLPTGHCLGMESATNRQGRFGDNIVTRISHACANPSGLDELRRSLVADSLIPLVGRLCEQVEAPPDAITEMVVTGNTAMLHTLAGASLEGLSKYPFRPVFLNPQTWSARALGFFLDVPVRAVDCLGAFVGADITAGAVAAGLLENPGPALLIDFGTNGEILLKHQGGYFATATAAGPAFEGGRLRCGAPAGPGVVAHLQADPSGWTWVDCAGAPAPAGPRGLSGAAYVDFIAEARRTGLIQENGRFSGGHSSVQTRVIEGRAWRRVALTDAIYVSETDIAELIQAKAAIMGGVMTLLERAGLDGADLERIFIAGGFGYHLDLEHAVRIGLLPRVAPDRYAVVGNASLGGASLLLLRGDTRLPEAFTASCEVVELNRCPSFEDHFIDGMGFPELDPVSFGDNPNSRHPFHELA